MQHMVQVLYVKGFMETTPAPVSASDQDYPLKTG
jgi:hypothetical protein